MLGSAAMALPPHLLDALGFDALGAPQVGGAAWTSEALFWVAVAGLVAVVVAAVGAWAVVLHLREVLEEVRRLARLEELDQKLGRLVEDREDLDLRRLEHVLIDLRDGQRRLSDALLQLAERRDSIASRELVVPADAGAVSERVTNRCLALGFERIHLVSRSEELDELLRKDGEVLVEARKDGVLHKGRVLLRGGRIADVEMNPAYSIFP